MKGSTPKPDQELGGDEGYGMISYDLWWFKISYDFPILWQWSTPKTKVIYNNYSISISPSLTLSIYIRLCPPIDPSVHPPIYPSIHHHPSMISSIPSMIAWSTLCLWKRSPSPSHLLTGNRWCGLSKLVEVWGIGFTGLPPISFNW